eukprot:NODE_335_length_10686_cov_0.203363.p10 type:complete len:109 gc:universal NODE_335_length_10686_cov_0.203363:658-984(+)
MDGKKYILKNLFYWSISESSTSFIHTLSCGNTFSPHLYRVNKSSIYWAGPNCTICWMTILYNAEGTLPSSLAFLKSSFSCVKQVIFNCKIIFAISNNTFCREGIVTEE